MPARRNASRAVVGPAIRKDPINLSVVSAKPPRYFAKAHGPITTPNPKQSVSFAPICSVRLRARAPAQRPALTQQRPSAAHHIPPSALCCTMLRLVREAALAALQQAQVRRLVQHDGFIQNRVAPSGAKGPVSVRSCTLRSNTADTLADRRSFLMLPRRTVADPEAERSSGSINITKKKEAGEAQEMTS